MNKVNVAVIGCGNVSWRYHFPGLKNAPNISVNALVDTNLERAMMLKNQFLGSKDVAVTNDYREVLESPHVQAVIIATPPNLHESIALDALKAGKHVFCEKPFVVTVEEAKSVLRALKGTNLKFMVGFNYRFIPHFSKMADLLRKGAIGKPVMARTIFFSRIDRSSTYTGFHLNSNQGGGALFEMGCHHIDILLWLLGKIKGAYASILRINPKFSVDDTAFVFLEFENGPLAFVEVSWALPPMHRIEMIGTDGRISSDLSENFVELFLEGRSIFKRGAIRIPVKTPMESYALEFREFADSILEDRQPCVSALDGLEALSATKACYESSRAGQKVTLS